MYIIYVLYMNRYISYMFYSKLFVEVQQNVLTPRIGYGYFQNILVFFSISKHKQFLVFVVPALC